MSTFPDRIKQSQWLASSDSHQVAAKKKQDLPSPIRDS